MSFAQQILYDIAEEIGKPKEVMNKFIDILEENMCDTELAIKGTSIEELNELGLPKFIAIKLTKKVGNNKGFLPTSCLKKPKKELKMVLKEDIKVEKIQDKSIVFLDKILKELFIQYISTQEKFNSLNLLEKILKNILKNPSNEKFRKLNKSNNKLYMNLWKFNEIHDLIKNLNFKSENNFYFIEQKEINNKHFEYLIKKLDNELKIVEKKLNNGFNPFKPSFRTNNPNFDMKVVGEMAKEEGSNYYTELQKLKNEREKLIRNHKVNRNVKIYRREAKMEIEDEKDEKIIEIDEKKMERKEQGLLLKRRFLEFQKNFYKEISFSNSRKKEFDEITKKNLNLETIIRIKLPNRYIIEANFHVNDKLESIFNLLNENLIKKEGYFLFVAPFVKNKLDFKDSQKSLSVLSLVPDANLNLLYKEQGLNKEKSTFLLKESI